MSLGLGLNAVARRGFTLGSLFAAGELGAVYDPSNFSSMYQDSSGITPVTAVGQNVGMILDSSFGLRRGPELIPDPSFDNPSAWGVAGADATHVVTIGSGTLRYQSDTTTPTLSVSSSPNLVIPANSGLYEITVVVSAWVSGGIKTDSFIESSPTIASGPGTFRRMVMAKAADTSFSFLRSTTNVDMTIDSISIKAVPGWHAWDNTVANQPPLAQDGNGRFYLSGDGVSDGLTSVLLPASGLAFPFTVATAAQANGEVLAGIFGLRGGSPPYYEIQKTTGANQWRAFLRGLTLDANNIETVGTNATPHYGLAEYTSSTVNLRMDGVDTNAASAQSNAVGSIIETRIMRGSAGYFAGKFYGGIIRFGTLSAAQRAGIEQWLKSKIT